MKRKHKESGQLIDQPRLRMSNDSFQTVWAENISIGNSSIQDWASRFPVILSCYEARDIFDTDETDLFYQAIPDRSFVLSKEDCKGEKKSMERLTILLTNLTILNTCRVAGFGKPTSNSYSMDANDAITEPELQLINNDDPIQQLDTFISSYSD
ncbi:unnamed protein product [Rotaria socialis]|uniref:Uncharacterized protein n=1 Tax=Rotaria socialis TaxID=392032 RepID=A0A817Z4L0_9BILA|nr:unnamed protein product [Rotaria socialis]CAF4329963.1 unnamed protein product [Rotaria socialis]CAF4471250.1 unnamed protein product [Rotaria socialis]